MSLTDAPTIITARAGAPDSFTLDRAVATGGDAESFDGICPVIAGGGGAAVVSSSSATAATEAGGEREMELKPLMSSSSDAAASAAVALGDDRKIKAGRAV